MGTRVIRVQDDSPQATDAAAEGARALRAGQLVGFPTETVYGIAAMATHADAMERLREIKSRPAKPFSVHLGRPEDAGRYVQPMPRLGRLLAKKAWPGPVTLVVPTGGRQADEAIQKANLAEVLCWQGQIGLRCPEGNISRMMLSAVPDPVVAPSANLTGAPSPRTADDVLSGLDGRIDLLIDCGPTRYGTDSTIVAVNDAGWEVIREGVLDERAIKRLLHQTLLFVCSGNTCRSPIAASLARRMLAQRLGCGVGDLRKHGFEVLSAGLHASEGQRASPEAIEAAKEHGADISRHRTRKLTAELINASDMIFCMEDFQIAEVRRLAASTAGKVQRLEELGEIPDPVGAGSDAYRKTAERIEAALAAQLDKELGL